jgi:hypothetical protein
MCKHIVEGVTNTTYSDHFEVCEKLTVLSSCSLCGHEDQLGLVLIHESACTARRLATKEEVLAMYNEVPQL